MSRLKRWLPGLRILSEYQASLVPARCDGWPGAGARRYRLCAGFGGSRKRFELFDRFCAADFYPTIGSAVDAYLEEHAVDWKP